ncbi:MAG: hydroxymethylpyrimidine/phosphomethylpyrimidine kinase [Deltaproteobacteria bacterium]|nr:hydroxymethylpyrimidine/phosphomethylpyrimidine kinase [Deltaproteobacteria bacterium]
MQSVLSIAGSDPTGGAGFQADCQVAAALGVHAAAVPTALTIQDGLRVKRVLPVFPTLVLEQLRATLEALRPDAIKIGMLASDDVVRNVLLALAPWPAIPVVIDPVLAASDGTLLLERRAYGALRDLFHGRTLLTPNWPEAEILLETTLPRRADGEAAARELLVRHDLEAVLLKGGHLEGDASDLLVRRVDRGGPSSGAAGGTSGADGERKRGEIVAEWLPGERIPGPAVHGTGCALSAAIAAHLARGETVKGAVVASRRYVREAIRRAHALPNGARLLAFR